MIHIAVVDDEKSYISQIQQYLEQFERESGETIKVSVFSDGDSIVHKYNSEYDIIFMDVEMKFMDGMSAAEEIRKKDSEVVIIFITNMPQYAIRGYAVDALDYILKPVSYFAFSQCLQKAIVRRNNRAAKFVVINLKKGTARINIENIIYIETAGHSTVYHTVEGDYESYVSLNEAEEQLKQYHFFRISKWCLVNIAHVDNYQDGYISLGKTTLAVSRSKRKELLDKLVTYWGEVI